MAIPAALALFGTKSLAPTTNRCATACDGSALKVTPTYGLAEWLTKHLKKLTKGPEHTAASSKHFLEKVRGVTMAPDEIVASKIGGRVLDFKKLTYEKLREAQSSLAKAVSDKEKLRAANEKGETEILRLKMIVGTLNRAILEKDALLNKMRETARRLELSFIEYGLNQVPQYEKLNQRLTELSDFVSEKDRKIRTLIGERDEYINLHSVMQNNIQEGEKRTTDLQKGIDDAKERLRQLTTEYSLLKEDYELQIKRGYEKEKQIKLSRHSSKVMMSSFILHLGLSLVDSRSPWTTMHCDLSTAPPFDEFCWIIGLTDDEASPSWASTLVAGIFVRDDVHNPVLALNNRSLKTSLREISRSESDLRNISTSQIRSNDAYKNPSKAFLVAPSTDLTMPADINDLREKLEKAREHAYQLELNQRLVFAQLVWLASDRKHGVSAHLSEPSKSTKTSARSSPGRGRPAGAVNRSMGVLHARPQSRHSESTCLCDEGQTTAHLFEQSKIITQINELFNEKDEKIKQAKEKEFLLKQQILMLRNAKAPDEVKASNGTGPQKGKPRCLSDRLRRAELRLAKALTEAEKWQKCCDEKESELEAERTHTRDLQTVQKADMLVRNKFLQTICQILASSLHQSDLHRKVTSDVPAPAVIDASSSKNHHLELCERKSLCPSGDFPEESLINSNFNCSKETSAVRVRGTNSVFRRRKLPLEPKPWNTLGRPASEEKYDTTNCLETRRGFQSLKTTSTPKSQVLDASITVPYCETAPWSTSGNYQVDSLPDWDQLTLETTKLLTTLIAKTQPATMSSTSQQRTPSMERHHLACPGEASSSSQAQAISDCALKAGEQAELVDAALNEKFVGAHHPTCAMGSQSIQVDRTNAHQPPALAESASRSIRHSLTACETDLCGTIFTCPAQGKGKPQCLISRLPQRSQINVNNSQPFKQTSNKKAEGRSCSDSETPDCGVGKNRNEVSNKQLWHKSALFTFF
nr:unnamed protein product [Spirometra erinaceieuropaei]